MPYIKQKDRPYLETAVLELTDLVKKCGDGEVKNNYTTYCVYLFIKTLYGDEELIEEGLLGWEEISDGVKVLETSCDEFKRRVLHPYEDTKIKENGDV